ncbi:MAG: hypothetical protein QOG67_2783 [Verrucomicrobiota bacterium]
MNAEGSTFCASYGRTSSVQSHASNKREAQPKNLVIDLNHIFLFVAIVSPLVILARSWRSDAPYRGWCLAACIVLGVTTAAWVIFRNEAGYIGGGAWLALLFLPAIGLKRMTELFAMQRYKSARRLAAALQWLHPSKDLREQIQLLRTLEARHTTGGKQRSGFGVDGRATNVSRRWRQTPAVMVLIVLNILAFGGELCAGYWSNPAVLHTLGALEPYFVLVHHEYWRLFTALFLHYDVTHLLFNVFALYVLGPPLERAIGAARFCFCYLVSGLGSSAGVVALTLVGVVHAAQLIGASGSVMGIVGAWAGFLLRHRHSPLAKQRLNNVLMIVAIQTVFDLTTPQISMSAHLCGLVTGFIAGLIVSPRIQGAAASQRPN